MATEDVDTCRICRVEGSSEEPLFHPCRCSGSIGFVHQDCLMEWLSHSQKKHCELCKTSFRFTKLYDPQMPTSLPTTVFLQRATLHIISAALTWCRAIVVFMTWIVCLPWCMRFVWWSLFWVADGGYHAHLEPVTLSDLPGSVPENVTLTAAINSSQGWLGSLKTFADGIVPFKLFSDTLSTNDTAFSAATETSTPNITLLDFPDRGTLLSGFGILRNATRSQAFNAFLMDILEGGIITLAVIIAFILVFLIREWVVQQQPVLNLAAANNQEEQQAVEDHPPAEAVQQETPDDEQRAPTTESPDVSSRETNAEPDEGDVHNDSVGQSRNTSTGSGLYTSIDDLLLVVPSLRATFRRMTDVTAQTVEDSFHLSDPDEVEIALQSAYIHLTVLESAAEGTLDVESDAAQIGYDKMQRISHYLPERLRDEFRQRLSSVCERLDLDPPTDSDADSQSDSDDSASSDQDTDASSARARTDSQDSHSSSEASRSSSRPRTRPTMPDRIESSLGTDIRRTMEEAMSHQESERHTDGETDGHSDESGESWQHVSNSESASRSNPGVDEVQAQPTDIRNQDGPIPHNTAMSVSASTSDRQIVAGNDGWMDGILNWLWDEAPQPRETPLLEERLLEVNDEAPFVRVNEARLNVGRQEQEDEPANPAQDPEVVAAAAEAGLNPNEDIQDDLEDLDGLMELIGMQGPIAGLVQNALFTTVVIAVTVVTAVWFPYICGKIVLLISAYPVYALTLPYRVIEMFVSLATDLAVWSVSEVVLKIDYFIRLTISAVSIIIPFLSRLAKFDLIDNVARRHSKSALKSLIVTLLGNPNADATEYVYLSTSSHIALRRLQIITKYTLEQAGDLLSTAYTVLSTASSGSATLKESLSVATKAVPTVISAAPGALQGTANFVWSVITGKVFSELDQSIFDPASLQSLGTWSLTDRVLTIGAGYAFFAVAGIFYMSKLAPITTSTEARKVEDVVMEILSQAGGVLKVILIISIEMLLFPLYCGFLLDFAMLPLFGNASFMSRLSYTASAPWTSAFIHWFIGTCYMFHFALFVSMCRRIMRRGVLYFIRDPDDPTFHPVRDVLERKVISQLRKIAFSALIYGGLVIVCLGSIVWTLAYCVKGVLPIRWMPMTGAVGFPVDLLLYTALKPFLVRWLAPTDGMQAAYDWWFRFCARQLRLSDFLFGDQRTDERLYDGEKARSSLTLRDGRFVRVPASDQVRIPRGTRVFLEVNEENNRVDGVPDPEDSSNAVHGKNNKEFALVYVPSRFRTRISAFIFCLWVLTAAIGLGFTVAPLLLGRFLLSLILPAQIEASDIYAFSIGFGILGGSAYAVLRRDQLKTWSLRSYDAMTENFQRFIAVTKRSVLSGLRLTYVYGLGFVLAPALLALLSELYFVGPLHSYFSKDDTARPHIIRLAQNWTIGVQYMRVLLTVASWYPESRFYRALNRIVARGWWNPDVRLATRGFALPAVVLTSLAIVVPALVGSVGTITLPDEIVEGNFTGRVKATRLAYPAVFVLMMVVWIISELVAGVTRWRSRIKDEVYLIGERLHNFGEATAARHRPRAPDAVAS